ncbi:hypothetical protein [Aquimarina rhabdastrellae]
MEVQVKHQSVIGTNNEINWDGGQRITLRDQQTAVCEGLKAGQLYGIFFYNASQSDHDIDVIVNWSNGSLPVTIKVPGTTGNNGLASVALVSGSETNTVSVSIKTDEGSGSNAVDTWIGSVGMPINTAGLINQEMPINENMPFDKFRRYYRVPSSQWYNLTINSNRTQFMSIQFIENQATVFIVNPGPNAEAFVTGIGSVTENKDFTIVKPKSGQPQTITNPLFGNGGQFVWMNIDSQQNSDDSNIILQQL